MATENLVTTTEEWPELEPLDATPEPTPFPTHALPPSLRAFVEALATAKQLPTDMAGFLALSAVSIATQGRLNVLADNGKWLEPVCLYTVTTADPGERKSFAVGPAFRPLVNWELDKFDQEANALSVNRAEHAALAERVKATLNDLTKAETTHRRDVRKADMKPDDIRKDLGDIDSCQREHVAAQLALDNHHETFRTRLAFHDITPEAAIAALAQQKHHHIAFMSAEGGPIEGLTGRYNDKSSIDVWLQGHTGETLITDRIGRESDIIERPIINFGLAVQPQILQDIGKVKQLAGRGLLARFLWSVPAPMVGRRVTGSPDIPGIVQTTYGDTLRDIANDAYSLVEPRTITLAPEADAAWQAFNSTHEPRMLPDEGDLAIIGLNEWSSKLIGALIRIAALIAAWRAASIPDTITPEDINAALLFAPYLIDHARAAYRIMGLSDSMHELPRKVLRAIQRQGFTQFTRRELQHACYATRGLDEETLDDALEILKKHGYVKRITDSTKPYRYHWNVNPATHEPAITPPSGVTVVTAPVLTQKPRSFPIRAQRESKPSRNSAWTDTSQQSQQSHSPTPVRGGRTS